MVVKKVILYMQHPAEANMYRYVYPQLTEHGITVKVAIMEREDMVSKLAKVYADDYEIVGYTKQKIIHKAMNLFNIDKNLYKIAKAFKPDIITSFSSAYPGHVASMLDFAHIGYNDTEVAHLNTALSYSFQNTVLTPSWYIAKAPKKKHVTFNGSKELAYLHPRYFKPDPSIFNILGLKFREKFIVLRFSAFDATHDINIKGFSFENKKKLVNILEKYGRIFISSEIQLPNSLRKYKLNIPPEKMHDVLFYTSLLVGDTGTMTAEAAYLGTPAILLHPNVKKFGNFLELENNYGLIFGYEKEANQAIEKAIELIQNQNLEKIWQIKRKKILKDKIDVTSFLVWFIENYPESHELMKKNSNYQKRFKSRN